MSKSITAHKNRKRGIEGRLCQIFLHLYVWLNVLFVMFPFLLTVFFSFKSVDDFLKGFWALPSTFQFSNYAYSLSVIGTNMLNSILYSACVCVFSLFIASITAFVFTRYDFRFKKFLFTLIISMMMIPGVLTLTPSYLLTMSLNLRNTPFAIILPSISTSIVSGVFLFSTFMGQHPAELYESASLDGAGTFRMYIAICLPLSVPVIMIQLITLFSSQYNDYMWPMLVIDDNKIQTLMPLLRKLTGDAYAATLNPGVTYAIYLCSGIPLVFTSAIGLKYFVNGDFASGMKL